MMFVLKPWPVTTSAPGPSSDERRQRTSTWPCASSPADTALISYSVRTGRQPSTGWRAASTAPKSALTGPFPRDSVIFSSPATTSDTLPTAWPPDDDVTFQPSSSTDRGTAAVRCSTSARRSASVTSFFASASAIAAWYTASRASPSRSWPSSRSLPCRPRRPDSLPIDNVLPTRPTDCGVMISYVSGFLITPSWWIPDSWAKAFAPTIALFGWTAKPVRDDTSRDALVICSVATRVTLSANCVGRVRRAITTSSSDALPARSPRPLIVAATGRAPAWTAARVFAVASPRSLWQWTLTVASLPTSPTTCPTSVANSAGIAYPTVSGMLTVVAPASTTAS